jgi:hypothetical protein
MFLFKEQKVAIDLAITMPKIRIYVSPSKYRVFFEFSLFTFKLNCDNFVGIHCFSLKSFLSYRIIIQILQTEFLCLTIL